MTKKDFELIASIINRAKDYELKDTNFKDVCLIFALTYARLYPRFNKEKFLKACGIKKDWWVCPDCVYNTIWTNYKDGTPICPHCDIDLVQE